MSIAYESDLALTLDVIRPVVQANARVLADPAPVIQVVKLADSAVCVAIKPWVAVADFTAAHGELNLAVLEELHRRGIVIPFPQQEVRLLGKAA